jgi:hypothetical protein
LDPEQLDERQRRIYLLYTDEDAMGNLLSNAELLKELRKRYPEMNFKLEEVRAFKRQLEHEQLVETRRRWNSYVASGPRQEFDLDFLFFKNDEGAQEGLLAIDIFTKRLAVVPVPKVSADTAVQAFKEVLRELGTPETVYTDLDKTFESGAFQSLLQEHGVKHLWSRNHVPFADRAIRTLKEWIRQAKASSPALQARLGKQHLSWTDVLPQVLRRYATHVHATTDLAPDSWRLTLAERNLRVRDSVRAQILKHATFRTHQPELQVGDTVRLRTIEDYKEKKTSRDLWSRELHTVTGVHYHDFGTTYDVTNSRQAYGRSDLLKVDRVLYMGETPAAEQLNARERRLGREHQGLANLIHAWLRQQPALPAKKNRKAVAAGTRSFVDIKNWLQQDPARWALAQQAFHGHEKQVGFYRRYPELFMLQPAPGSASTQPYYVAAAAVEAAPVPPPGADIPDA